MEIDRIYNCDCLEGMKLIPDGSVDCISCDLPYGTMKTAWKGLDEFDDRHSWDDIIPTDKLFAAYDRVLRKNGVAVLFSQEPYTTHLRGYNRKSNIRFCYPMMWKKNTFGMPLNAKHAPVSFFEDISVFVKPYDSNGTNSMRDYFKGILTYIGLTKKEIMQAVGERADHVLRVDSTQWALCTAETYNEFIRLYHIDQMQGFRSYEDLQKEDEAFKAKYSRVFNLPEDKAYLGNVLEFPKESQRFHPTQKPVELIAQLVRTFSNPGDTILDNTIGSGTTAVAALREKRHFIGFELNKDYYEKACKRIKAEQSQLKLQL